MSTHVDGELRGILSLACRLILLGGLIATAGLLAACGSNSHPLATATTTNARAPSTTNTHPPPATTTPKGAIRAPSKTQAIAFARAVNLTAADVPGFKPTSGRESKPETAVEKQLANKLLRCIGGQTSSSPAQLAKASSADFKLDHDVIHLSVKSEVSVAQTPALAAEELGVIRNNRVRVCLSHYFNLLLKNRLLKERSSVSPNSISTSIAQGTPPAPGATGSYWWRITATITVRKIKLPFYIDILGFTYGAAKVSLFSSGALRPFPAAAQEHLYRLLLQRAEAHSV